MKFIYKKGLDEKSNYQYRKSSKNDITSSYEQLRKSLEKNKLNQIAINSIITKTDYTNYAITIVDNQSTQASTKKLFKKLK